MKSVEQGQPGASPNFGGHADPLNKKPFWPRIQSDVYSTDTQYAVVPVVQSFQCVYLWTITVE